MEINKNNFAERFTLLMELLGVNGYQMAKTLGLDRADRIYKLCKGSVNPQYEFLCSIAENYPAVNLHALITGKGNLLFDEKNVNEIVNPNVNVTPEKVDFNRILTLEKEVENLKTDNRKQTNTISDLSTTVKEQNQTIKHLSELLAPNQEQPLQVNKASEK